MQVENYRQFGGSLMMPAALRNVAGYHRVIGRQTSAALTEPMLFGIAGGIGATCQVVGAGGAAPQLKIDLGPRYKGLVSDTLQALCVRLGLPASFRHTSSVEIATLNLRQALSRGEPPLVFGDAARISHLAWPSLGDPGYVGVLYGIEGEGADAVAQLADLSSGPVGVPLAELLPEGSARHLYVFVNAPAAPVDLPKALEGGLRACCERMLDPPHPKTAYGLRALQRLAESVLAEGDPEGWPSLFPPGGALLEALLTLYAAIELGEAGPQGGRAMFATFLGEAGAVLQGPDLGEAIDRYEALAGAWQDLGEALLPESCPPLGELRRLLQARAELLGRHPVETRAERETIRERIVEIRAAVARDFPLDEAGRRALLVEVQERLQTLAADEEMAIRELKLTNR